MDGRRNLTAQKTALPFGRHTRVPAYTLAPPGEYDKMICAAAMRDVATFTVETRPRSAELLSDCGGTAAAVQRHEQVQCYLSAQRPHRALAATRSDVTDDVTVTRTILTTSLDDT